MAARAKVLLLALFAIAPWFVLLGLIALSARFWMQGDADQLQRLGSVYVACGVFLAVTRPVAFDRFHRFLDAVFGPSAEEGEGAPTIETLDRNLEIFEAKGLANSTFFYGEAVLVICGTILWGYGDLILAAFQS